MNTSSLDRTLYTIVLIILLEAMENISEHRPHVSLIIFRQALVSLQRYRETSSASPVGLVWAFVTSSLFSNVKFPTSKGHPTQSVSCSSFGGKPKISQPALARYGVRIVTAEADH